MKQNQKTSWLSIIKKISKALSWIIFVFLIIIALLLLYYFIATKIYVAKGPGYEPAFSIYTIISPSMTPKIKVYDTVVNVHVKKPDDIKINDVITFRSTSLINAGTTVTHRVVGITKDIDGNVCYTTKGDFNPVEDQACAKFSNVLGKVIFKIPQLGRLQFFIASPPGWIICILLPAAIIIIRDILKITKLTSLKEATKKLNDAKTDPKKYEAEQKRKEDLKRKLIKEEYSLDDNYYHNPNVAEIDKPSMTIQTNQNLTTNNATEIDKSNITVQNSQNLLTHSEEQAPAAGIPAIIPTQTDLLPIINENNTSDKDNNNLIEETPAKVEPLKPEIDSNTPIPIKEKSSPASSDYPTKILLTPEEKLHSWFNENSTTDQYPNNDLKPDLPVKNIADNYNDINNQDNK